MGELSPRPIAVEVSTATRMASLSATSPAEIRNGSLNGIWRCVKTTRSMGLLVVMGLSSLGDRSEQPGRDRPTAPPLSDPAGPPSGPVAESQSNTQSLTLSKLETREVASVGPFR